MARRIVDVAYHYESEYRAPRSRSTSRAVVRDNTAVLVGVQDPRDMPLALRVNTNPEHSWQPKQVDILLSSQAWRVLAQVRELAERKQAWLEVASPEHDFSILQPGGRA